jgi:hypothetical protein
MGNPIEDFFVGENLKIIGLVLIVVGAIIQIIGYAEEF